MAVVTLGCARNEVDSEELAGRLAADGYRLVDDADGADAVLVNTCGFIESAKKDSVDAILAATDSGANVVAIDTASGPTQTRAARVASFTRSTVGGRFSTPPRPHGAEIY